MYRAGMDAYEPPEDEPIDRAARVMAIVNCPLCDDEGYRGGSVCDHIDRTDTYRRGMAKVREALAREEPK
jgi:hypothetical protein